jgi:hypothetical protein
MPHHTVAASWPRLCDPCPKRSPVYALGSLCSIVLSVSIIVE